MDAPPGKVWNDFAGCWDDPCDQPPCRCPHVPPCNPVCREVCGDCDKLRFELDVDEGVVYYYYCEDEVVR
jgi:hypothetical protein